MPIKRATFRFYEELNYFISNRKGKREFTYSFYGFPKVKDAIESYGVPHTEVDLILANGKSVNFDYELKDNDRIAVYPKFESIDISEASMLRNTGLREIKFILDVHLGKLARYLRLAGFDSHYHNELKDNEIIDRSLKNNRIILTRDKGILKNNKVTHGYYIRSDNPVNQLKEVLKRFDLKDQVQIFTRCMECNGMIHEVSREKVDDQLLPDTKNYFDEFYQCKNCKKVYWKGSHYENMKKFIQSLLDEPE